MNAGSHIVRPCIAIAVNLPNNEEVQLAKGTRRMTSVVVKL